MKKFIAMLLTLSMTLSMMSTSAVALSWPKGDADCTWDSENLILTLDGAELDEGIYLPGGSTIIVEGDSSIDGGEEPAIFCEGALTIEGEGTLTLTGQYGIKAHSLEVEGVDVDFSADSCGIYVYNVSDDTTVSLLNVDGEIEGGYAGIYVVGECADSEASCTVDGCDLDVTSTATGWNKRARHAGIAVYASTVKRVETSISIKDSELVATGYDAGLSINNYIGDADATNSASSRIDIDNSKVTAYSTGGTWAGIFASVLGQHADADAIITITDSSVYAVSENTGILTSSQKGESRIILDNSVLGASGKTALSMIEETSQKQAAELTNGSTYIQMTPDAVMKGEIENFDGKVITAIEGQITYDDSEPYFVIPQNAVVTETYTDGTENTYTFTQQAGGVGGFTYENEEIWGYDVYEAPDYVCYIDETGVYYETLTAAVADANASEGDDTIVMIKDIDFDSDKALSVTGNITIISEPQDEVAHTISRGAYTGTMFTVPAGSSLTLDGGIVFDGSNNWIFEKELYENDLYGRVDNPISAYAYSAEGGTCGTAALFVVNGAMTVKDATIENFFSTKDSNSGDAAIFKVNANATLTTDGALIDHCATYGANTVAHLATNAKWYIQGDTMISNNFGGRNGGICRNDSGQIYMSGGTIKDTAGKNVNGTVFMMYGTGSAFYMTGGTICGNSSTFGANNGRCAAVYLHANSYMKMTGGTICHNIGGTRGGIDSYKSSSVLDINRVDQDFENESWKESGKAAYTAENHPYIIDNVSLIDNTSHDVGHSFNFDTWWVTGGIYTQDVDEFCAEGYICIPYEDSARTDDYIVVPGYRVKYFSVEKTEGTNAETGEPTVEYVTTLEKKYFHMLPRDKFWYEMDERANYFELTNADGDTISTWYTEKELENVYDFANEKLESDLDLYGQWLYIPEELGTKGAELLDRKSNLYNVFIEVPGDNGDTRHDEVILMVDGSYSMDNEWPAMKEAINTIGQAVLNGSGTTQLTLMAFGMADNEVLVHVKDADELAAALGELPGNLLYGRSSTNCEAGFDGVANYIKNHDDSLKDVHVIFISDGNVNTDETPRAFDTNWKTWTKFGPLTVAQTAFEETLYYGENLPEAFNTVFGDRFDGATIEEIANRAFGGEVTDAEFIAFADQVWADVYAYSNLTPGAAYPVSVAERAFVKYDKEHDTYIQDIFYYTTYKSAYVTYGDRWTRTPAAANELAAMSEVASMYVVDYDGYTAWMDTGITSEKSTFVKSNGIAGLCNALAGAMSELSKTPFNDVFVTDYMSKWVNLDPTSIQIIDNNSGKVIWDINDGWLIEENIPTAKNPPVVVELVDPADYEAGGTDVIGNTSGDIYKLTWYVKDGAMLRSDNYKLSYEVTVDTKENGFKYEVEYPANGTTELTYTDKRGDEQTNDIEVPEVDAELSTAELKVQKVDENGNALPGAVFELFTVNADGSKTSLGEFAVDSKGELALDLAAGDHLLVETKAPSGYVTAADAIEITVDENLAINADDTKTASYENGTLTVVNRPPHAAVVLTIDMSGTMYRNKMDGKRYVDVAKAKALEFVKEYAASSEKNGKRMLAVVCFDTDAKIQQKWIDVSTAAGLKTATTAINNIKVADNGKASSNQVCTNFDAGIILSRNLLKQATVSDIDRCFTIILSDGAPTVTVNNDTNTVSTIKSSFWGNQLDANGKKYQNARAGGGWTHPAEVARTLTYMKDLEKLTYDYMENGEKQEGIFIVGVGGLMNFKLFNDAVYGTSNGTRTSDVKKKPAAFNNIDALAGYTQAQILKLTTGDWMNILATKVGGSYVSATNTAALKAEFTSIMNAIKDTTTPED